MWFSLGRNAYDKHSLKTIASIFRIRLLHLGDLCFSMFINQINSKILLKQIDVVGIL